MSGYVPRLAEPELTRALARSPTVAILGPRQVGITTANIHQVTLGETDT